MAVLGLRISLIDGDLPKSQKQTVFRTALYVRLSVEDNGKADADLPWEAFTYEHFR